MKYKFDEEKEEKGEKRNEKEVEGIEKLLTSTSRLFSKVEADQKALIDRDNQKTGNSFAGFFKSSAQQRRNTTGVVFDQLAARTIQSQIANTSSAHSYSSQSMKVNSSRKESS